MSEMVGISQAQKDAYILDLALKSIKDGANKKGGPMVEMKGRRFNEMVKQMEAAKSQAEQGISLSGVSKKMVDTIRNYTDGGTQIAGGKKEPAAFKESMCVLKHFMPEQEFGAYCNQINQAQGAQSVKHKRNVQPESFDVSRLSGQAMTAKELFLQSKREISKGLTMEGCAKVAAVTELCGGNPGKLIKKEDLARQMSRLLTPGSAFRRTMDDKTAYGKFSELADKGKVIALGQVSVKAAKAHSVRAAQWQINNSTAALAKGGTDPKKSGELLSNILAARELAASPSAASMITKDAFSQRAKTLSTDPGFVALNDHYSKDRSFRNKINGDLQNDNSATGLAMAYHQAKNPVKEAARGLSL